MSVVEPDFHAWAGTGEDRRPFNPGGGFGATQAGAGIYTRDPGENETVEGRLNGLLSSGSEYIQSAEAAGRRFASQRGLLNSSLAAQSSRQAAINAGLPIAQADAAMYAQAAGQNVDWLNQSMIRAIEAEAAANGAASSNYSQDAVYTNLSERAKDRALQERLLQMRIDADERSQGRGFDFQRDMTQEDRDWLREQGITERDFIREGWGRDDANRLDDRDFLAGQREIERDYERGMFDDTRADARDARRQSMLGSAWTQMLGTLFSSPDFFGNPEAARGFLEFFTSSMGELIDGYF